MDIKESLAYLSDIKLGKQLKKFHYIGFGSFGKVYKATDETDGSIYIFKVYRVENLAQKEEKSLIALSKNKSVKIPKVYFIHKKNEKAPFDCLCMEYIKGKNALMCAGLLLSGKETKRRFADEVTDGLLAIHSIKSKNGKFGYADQPVFNSWLEFYKPFAQDIFEKAFFANQNKCFDSYILDVMKTAWEKFDFIFDEDVYEPCLIHGDINIANIMVDKDYHLAGFIDPLHSMYADREYDIFQFQNLTGHCFKLYEIYKEKYQVSEKCDIKCAFYGLWNEAMVYLETGRYTRFIMKAAIKRMKKELNM
ncbi:MAG: phosphotransferase [Eubacterium sp.]